MAGILAEMEANWSRAREEAVGWLRERTGAAQSFKPELDWRTANDGDLLAHLVFCMITPQTRVWPNLMDAHPEIHRLAGFKGMTQPEIASELGRMKVRFPNEKSRRVSSLLSRDLQLKRLLRSLGSFSDGSLPSERQARDAFRGAAGHGFGLKIASLFLKDVGFARWLGVIDSRNFRFAQETGLVSHSWTPRAVLMEPVYLRFEDWEADLARVLGVTTADLDGPILGMPRLALVEG